MNKMDYIKQRDEVAAFMRRLYQQRLTTTSGGNISFRVPDGNVLLTASKFDKANLTGAQVGVLTVAGQNLTPELPPSIEAGMHLEIYRRYKDVKAIVHAHSFTASAFCATSREINCRLTAEAYAILGNPVYVSYALMGSRKLAELTAEALRGATCALLANHGAVCVGSNLLEAFDRLEVLEAAAQMTVIAEQLGNIRMLTSEQCDDIDCMMER